MRTVPSSNRQTTSVKVPPISTPISPRINHMPPVGEGKVTRHAPSSSAAWQVRIAIDAAKDTRSWRIFH